MKIDEITGIVINVAIDVHRRLGPGLLESAYRAVLAHELRKRGLRVESETPVPIVWDGIRMEVGFRADLIVEQAVLLELKSVDALAPVHKKQTLTYLRLANLKVGLLMNFNAVMMKDGIYRIVNGLEE